METVNNLASAASRAIWGDSTQTTTNETAGTEPVSGKLGNVEAGEPYDKGNEQVDTTNTNTSSAGLPTYLNYQKGETSSPVGATTTDSTVKDTPSSTNTNTTSTPSTNIASTSTPSENNTSDSTISQKTPTPTTSNPTTNTTSSMADNTPSTTLSKPTTTGSDTAAPSSRSDPAPAAAAVGNQEAIKKNVPSTSNNDDNEDNSESAQQARLKADGITETKGEGDHAPKFDTFKTSDGPHIEDGKNDGRVGPEYEKGDLKEFENHDGGKEGEGLKSAETTAGKETVGGVTTDDKAAHHTSASGSEVKKETSVADSENSAESGEKEKVSLKDKIKAKLHKH